jgi:hypothetical protein
VRSRALAERGVLAAVLLAVALWAQLRPSRPIHAPQPVPAERAQAWMVDALPGVGPKRRDQAVVAVRQHLVEDLPKAARKMAREVFSFTRP